MSLLNFQDIQSSLSFNACLLSGGVSEASGVELSMEFEGTGDS